MPEHSKPQPDDPARAVEVFYDGGCPLCRREISTYRRMIGEDAVDWRDVAGADAAPADLDREAALERFHIRRADGRIVSGARAFLAVWRASARLRPAARLLDRAPFVWILEGAYRAFLRIRPLWR